MAPNLVLPAKTCHDCTEDVQQPPSLLGLPDATEELCTATVWKARWWIFMLPRFRASSSRGFWCLPCCHSNLCRYIFWCPGIQIWSDVLQIIVRTLSQSDLIWEMNRVCLLCERNMRETVCQRLKQALGHIPTAAFTQGRFCFNSSFRHQCMLKKIVPKF